MVKSTSDRPGRNHYSVSWGKAAIAADARYVIIDKSDHTNYPHPNGLSQKTLTDCHILIHDITGSIAWQALSDGQVKVGVIVEVDASNASVKWFYVANAIASTWTGAGEGAVAADHSFDPLAPQRYYGATSALSDSYDEANTGFQTDVNVASPVTATLKPAAGDIVIEVVISAGAAAFDFTIDYGLV